MEIYNTLSRKVEKFQPIKASRTTLYCCGPTVYNFVHIGNLRTFIFYDILKRALRYKGYKPFQVINLTDVDDKTIENSKATGVTLREYTELYTKYFFEDMEKLNIEGADVYPKATDNINEMSTIIKSLIKKGYAYEKDDGIYYSIEKFADYGKLSGAKPSIEGVRVKKDEYDKENVADFALWKKWSPEDGEVFWDPGLPKGRPGWHIECSAMSMRYLGETIDIHSGGVDLMFPHHENEIAQSEAYTGKKFVNYWLHPEHLLVNGQKMSKSLKNFYTLRDLEQMGFDPLAFRLLVLDSHYRSRLDFSLESLGKYADTLKRVYIAVYGLDLVKDDGEDQDLNAVERAVDTFDSALDNDLDTHSALVGFFEFVDLANEAIKKKAVSKRYKDELKLAINKMDSVLGLLRVNDVPPDVKAMLAKREEARRRSDWNTADLIRDEIKNKGFDVVDLEGLGPLILKTFN